MMEKDSRILITGSEGMLGTNLVEELIRQGYTNLLTPTFKELNLVDAAHVISYFNCYEPEYVFHLAAKVGGILANIASPASFLYDNLMITSNVIEASKKFKIKKLINLGSSCIYPAKCQQPMEEKHLLAGKPEPTNEGYALAKICGLKLCEFYNRQYGTNFISLMPPNMYGPHDTFDSNKSHVISALISKMHNAKINKEKTVEIWGSGNASREFLYVSDCVDAMIYFMNNICSTNCMPFINIGTNSDIMIKNLAYMIKDIVGFEGALLFDDTKPEGMRQKRMDSSKSFNLGWQAKVNLREGLKKTYDWYVNKGEK